MWWSWSSQVEHATGALCQSHLNVNDGFGWAEEIKPSAASLFWKATLGHFEWVRIRIAVSTAKSH